jgi:preprotein translocase subunit Sec61beta
MATLSTPQSQAGVLSFYDAPEKGPLLNVKIFLGVVFAFSVVVLVFDHFLAAAA